MGDTFFINKREFDKPICLDRSDSLNQLNHFPKDIRFQVFLLDKNNKVVVIGNPVHNPNVKELYLEEIGRKQPVAPIQTTVKVEKESLLLETIPLGKSKDTLFTLVNTGDQPLVIIDVTTLVDVLKLCLINIQFSPVNLFILKWE